MIKIVASDIDGTLLPEGTMEINKELFSIIRKLNKKGIVFVAASGRSIESMEMLFEPIKNEIYFVSENGAFVKYKNEELSFVTLDRKAAEDFVYCARKIPDVNIVASKKDMLYIEGDNEELYNRLVYGYHNNVEVIDDVLKIKEEFIKISLYKKNAINDIAEDLIKTWGDRMHTMIAGPSWLDCVGLDADKGKALQIIQKKLGVSYKETMAFGDNHNDIGMLKQAEESYAVENAMEEVKKIARYITVSNKEHGVLKVLKEKLL
jgi:Cof subfamily protein (haloacid dehalogenase superfamily)